MAAAEILSELVRAHYAGDDARFANLLTQMIAAESRAGHVRLAERLRELRAAADQPKPTGRTTALARAPRELSEILSIEYSDVHLADVVLDPASRELVTRYVREQRAAERLAAHGLVPRRRLLLHGPPGCGKTLTAHALAGELRLPLARVRLEILFSRYLGETAAALTDIFAHAEKVRAVYLFDEFDALGRTRLADNDVGEVKRIVGTFLQLLDADRGQSVFIAATNIGGTLDKALLRRFDDVLELEAPTEDQRIDLLRRLLRITGRTRIPNELVVASAGLSFADIRAAVEDARKLSLLDGEKEPSVAQVCDALSTRGARLR